MWIVHAGWYGPDGPEYAVAGVFTKKDAAMDAAGEFVESLVCDNEDSSVKNDLGILLTFESGANVFSDEIQVMVEQIKLDKASDHIFNQITAG